IVVPAYIKADAERAPLGPHKRRRQRAAFDDPSLRTVIEVSLVLAKLGGEPACASQRLGVCGCGYGQPMRGRAGRRPSATDRHVVIRTRFGCRPMHDEQCRDEGRHDKCTERADGPRKPSERAAALARRIEEDWFAGHASSRWKP